VVAAHFRVFAKGEEKSSPPTATIGATAPRPRCWVEPEPPTKAQSTLLLKLHSAPTGLEYLSNWLRDVTIDWN
jgi:hypothetical protein